VVDADVAGELMYSSVSLADECVVKPAQAMTSSDSAMYKRNNNGLKTESCGTPQVSTVNVVRTPA